MSVVLTDGSNGVWSRDVWLATLGLATFQHSTIKQKLDNNRHPALGTLGTPEKSSREQKQTPDQLQQETRTYQSGSQTLRNACMQFAERVRRTRTLAQR